MICLYSLFSATTGRIWISFYNSNYNVILHVYNLLTISSLPPDGVNLCLNFLINELIFSTLNSLIFVYGEYFRAIECFELFFSEYRRQNGWDRTAPLVANISQLHSKQYNICGNRDGKLLNTINVIFLWVNC